MYTLVYLDGELYPPEKACLPVTEEGFLYGLGLFETIRVQEGIPLFFQEHLTRLFDSCRKVGINPTHSRGEMERATASLIQEGDLDMGRLRLNVIPHHFYILAQPGLPYTQKDYQSGYQAVILPGRRLQQGLLSRLKSFNFLENLLGQREARSQGVNEGLFLNEKGHLCEGSISNLFLYTKRKWVTPSLDQGLLPGITRSLILALLESQGTPGEEVRHLTPKDLYQGEEAFLTNSLMEIMPLIACDGHLIGSGTLGERTWTLQEAYQKMKEEWLEKARGK